MRNQPDEQGVLDHARPPDIQNPCPDPSFHQFPSDLGQDCTEVAPTAYRSSVPKSAASSNSEGPIERTTRGSRPYDERDSK